MAKLPSVGVGADYRYSRQAQFGGLKHCRACSDGEIYDMENVTLEEYPLLKARKKRTKLDLSAMQDRAIDEIYADNGMLLFVVGSNLILRGVGVLITDLKTGVQHQFIRFGDRVVLLPEMRLLNLIYDIKGIKSSASELPESAETEAAYAVKNTVTLPYYYDIYVYDGAQWVNNGRFDQPMEADTGVQPSIAFGDAEQSGLANIVTLSVPLNYITKVAGFKSGDTVTISGCAEVPENNKTAIIREITGDSNYCYLRFSDYCFTMPEEETEYTESNVRIRRVIPEMDFMFECNNRMWGAKNKRIYASKLGDPTNWYCFDGLSTDSWSIDTQTKGKIIGGWGDYYPYFLREDGMTVVYGTVPSGYQVYDKLGVPGLAAGEQQSIAHAGGLTLWLSREGVVIYGSDSCRIEKDMLRDWNIWKMIGASAGTKAYFICYIEDKRKFLLCYDSASGLWEKQNGNRLIELCYDSGTVYALRNPHEYSEDDRRSDVVIVSGDEGDLADEETVYSTVQFGDMYLNTEDRKATDLLLLRLELELGASLQVQIMYDSSGTYETVKTIYATDEKMEKQQFDIPIQPRRCDHYHIRLNGTGEWTLYSLTQNVRTGTERQ